MLLTIARLITAALLIATAAAFATATTIERHTTSNEIQAAQQDQRHHAETGGQGDNSAGVEGATSRESSTMPVAEHSSEKLLGVNPEATWLVVVAVVVSTCAGRADPHRAFPLARRWGGAGNARVRRVGYP